MTEPQRPEVRQGLLKAFNSGTYLASVQLTGSLGEWIENVATSRGIASAEMTAGRKVAVLVFDPANPVDSVIVAIYT